MIQLDRDRPDVVIEASVLLQRLVTFFYVDLLREYDALKFLGRIDKDVSFAEWANDKEFLDALDAQNAYRYVADERDDKALTESINSILRDTLGESVLRAHVKMKTVGIPGVSLIDMPSIILSRINT